MGKLGPCNSTCDVVVFVEDKCVGAEHQDGREQRVGAAPVRPPRDRCHGDDDATSSSFLTIFTPVQHVITFHFIIIA